MLCGVLATLICFFIFILVALLVVVVVVSVVGGKVDLLHQDSVKSVPFSFISSSAYQEHEQRMRTQSIRSMQASSCGDFCADKSLNSQLDALISSLINEYISSWYRPLCLPSTTLPLMFESHVDRLVRLCFLNILKRIQKVRVCFKF